MNDESQQEAVVEAPIEETTAQEPESNDTTPESSEDNDPYGLEQFQQEQEAETQDEDTTESEEEGGAPEQKTEEPKEETVTIDGREYTQEQVQAALKNFHDASKWKGKLTQEAQALAEEKKQLQQIADALRSKDSTKPSEPELSPEEQQTLKWLEEKGFVHKDVVDKKMAEFEKFREDMVTQMAYEDLNDELGELGEKYSLDKAKRDEVLQYAIDNDSLDRSMEENYLLMRKDAFAEFLSGSSKQDDRVAAAKTRQANAARVPSSKAKAPVQDKNAAMRYDRTRDKDKSVAQLAAEAAKAIGL